MLPAPPLYAAAMLCVPAVNALVAQCAVRVLPEPVKATDAQPAMEAPPSVKVTVPVGDVPVTLAVKVTFAPSADGLAELVRVVVVGGPAPRATVTSRLVGEADPTVIVTP